MAENGKISPKMPNHNYLTVKGKLYIY